MSETGIEYFESEKYLENFWQGEKNDISIEEIGFKPSR